MKKLLVHFMVISMIGWASLSCSPKAVTLIPTLVLPTAPEIAVPLQPSNTPAPSRTATQTDYPTPTASRTPTATPTPLPTATETLLPTSAANWQVPVIDISALEPWNAEWKDEKILGIGDYSDPITLVDAATGRVLSVATPTASLTDKNTAASGEMEIICAADGLKMVRLPDQSRVSASSLKVSSCYEVSWASDGSAAAFVTEEGGVYLWLPDGSEPMKIGEGLGWGASMWSPDNTQLLVLAKLKNNLDATLLSFNIVYPNGRPMLSPNTEIEAGNGWEMGLDWLTDATIRNVRGGPGYSIYDYYDARTGRFIIRNTMADGGRRPSLSPDGRWMILEASQKDTNWAHRWDSEWDTDPEKTRAGLMMVNLYTLKRSIVIQTTPQLDERQLPSSDSLKFLGWNAESSRFYFIHFPVGGPIYDLPNGLLEMNPVNGLIKGVRPGVAFGSSSPDRQHVFLVTADTIGLDAAAGLQAAIYRWDGAPVTPLQPAGDRVEYNPLNEIGIWAYQYPPWFQAEWSPDGRRLAFADARNNLWLMDTAGGAKLLASGLKLRTSAAPVEYLSPYVLSWSPDGQYLFVLSDVYAWIVNPGYR